MPEFVSRLGRQAPQGKNAGYFDSGTQRFQAIRSLDCHACGKLIATGKYFGRKTMRDSQITRFIVCEPCLKKWEEQR